MLTQKSATLLRLLVSIAAERNCCPLMPGDLTAAQRGNLTDLKAKGMLGATWDDDHCTWVEITTQGRAAAAQEGA